MRRPLLALCGLLFCAAVSACGATSGGVDVDAERAEAVRVGPPLPEATAVAVISGSTSGCALGCSGSVNTDYSVAGVSFTTVAEAATTRLRHLGYTVATPPVVTCAVLVRAKPPQGTPDPQLWCFFSATSAKWQVTVLGELSGVDFTPYGPLQPGAQRTLDASQNPPLTLPVTTVEMRVGPLPGQPT